MSRSLYAVATEQKTPQQHAREAVKRYRKMKSVDLLRLGQATVREGAGMKWMPSWYSFWWNAFVIRPPVGEIQRRLYGAVKGSISAGRVVIIPSRQVGRGWYDCGHGGVRQGGGNPL